MVGGGALKVVVVVVVFYASIDETLPHRVTRDWLLVPALPAMLW